MRYKVLPCNLCRPHFADMLIPINTSHTENGMFISYLCQERHQIRGHVNITSRTTPMECICFNCYNNNTILQQQQKGVETSNCINTSRNLEPYYLVQ